MGQSYPMTEADREIQAAARALAEELLPHEVEAELHGGELPDGLLEAHRRRVAQLGFEAVNMPKELGGGGGAGEEGSAAHPGHGCLLSLQVGRKLQ